MKCFRNNNTAAYVPSPCEVCGFLTHAVDERGRYFICPVCFWEDDEFHTNLDEPCELNHELSVNQAKQNFAEFGAVEKDMIEHTRPPTPEELPS